MKNYRKKFVLVSMVLMVMSSLAATAFGESSNLEKRIEKAQEKVGSKVTRSPAQWGNFTQWQNFFNNFGNFSNWGNWRNLWSNQWLNQ